MNSNLAHTLVAREPRDSYTDLSSVHAIRGLDNKGDQIEKVAQQFESMMLRMMIKSMRAANEVFAEGNYLSSNEGKTYEGMLDDQLALSLTQGRGMGLAESMVRQLKGQYGIADTAANRAKGVQDYLDHRLQPAPTVPATNSADLQYRQSLPTPAAQAFDGSVQTFVDRLYPAAQRAAERLGVEPSVLLAQAALETGWGEQMCRSGARSSNNLFNIKADQRWQGDAVTVPTLEFRNGLPVREQAAFRAYSSLEHSFEDYVAFVESSPRYSKALQHEGDPVRYIEGLAEGGYATDPDYAAKVLRIVDSEALREAVAESSADPGANPWMAP